MKFIFKIILPLLFCCYSAFPLAAAEKSPSNQNVSFGIAGNFGYYDAINRKGDNEYSRKEGYGGGIVIEKMFSNNFGVHSGLWFNKASLDYTIALSTVDVKTEWSYMSLSMPVYLMASINASFFSINILFGLEIEHIFYSKMKPDIPDSESIDVLKYIDYNQIGPGGGLQFKFRVSKYSDLFFGALASLRATEISSKDDSNSANVYNYRLTAGFLYRTDVFPTKE